MAGKGVKLFDISVPDLRRELEEKDPDSTVTNTVLQKQLGVSFRNPGWQEALSE